ncbi:MAG: TRAP transporter small permease [Deltaproteobacteria bacterium]|nr:TRAP transporter small permease [Deltaproteobacteria bacterium]
MRARRLSDRLNRLAERITVALLVAMVAVILLQVLTRYLLQRPLSWSEEVGRYLFIWLIFLGSSVCLKREGHVAVTLLLSWLPEGARRGVLIGGRWLVGAFLVILAVEGLRMLPVVAPQRSPAVQLSMAWVYAAVPFSALLMLLHLLAVPLPPPPPGNPREAPSEHGPLPPR